MRFNQILIAVLTLAAMPMAEAEGKFCLVTNNSKNCYYYDANQCRAEASRMGGMCVINDAQAPPSSSVFNGVLEAGEKGRQARFQRRAAQSPSQSSAAPTGTWDAIVEAEEARQGKKRVVYSCNGVQGELPAVGCVVIGYADP